MSQRCSCSERPLFFAGFGQEPAYQPFLPEVEALARGQAQAAAQAAAHAEAFALAQAEAATQAQARCFRKGFPILTSFAFAPLFCARWTSKLHCNFSAAELKKWAQAFPGCVRGRLGHPGKEGREVQPVLGPLPKGTLGGRAERSFEPELAWLWDHYRASRRYTEGRNWGCRDNPRGQRPAALFPAPVQGRPRRISGN